MKKLERISTEKFKVSETELNQIKGGYDGSISATYSEYDTATAGGGSVCDSRHSDSCIDW